MDSHGFLFYRWHEPPSSAAVLALHQLITADSVDSVDSDPSRPRAPSRLGRKSPSLSGSPPWAPANTAFVVERVKARVGRFSHGKKDRSNGCFNTESRTARGFYTYNPMHTSGYRKKRSQV